jgi:hypothetical protein
MKDFQLQVDIEKEMVELAKELDNIGEIKFSDEIKTYEQAFPLFENIGKDIAEMFDLEWKKIREYVVKRTKVVGLSKSLYKTAFKKDLLGGFWATHLFFQTPLIAYTIGNFFVTGQVDITCPLLICASYPVFHSLTYLLSLYHSPSTKPFPFYNSINIIAEPKEMFEFSFSHEVTHLMTFKYGKGEKNRRKLEGIAYEASFLVMDKKYKETGNIAYSYLKCTGKFTLASTLFCWREIKEKRSLLEALSKLPHFPSLNPFVIQILFASYANLNKYKKMKNPLRKAIYRKYLGLDHAEGYYKLKELENKYGSSVLKDIFLGKYDSEFSGKSS